MKTLLLKFSGPMQSYGTDSHFETRHTDYYPSKSAAVGLLAAALGWRRPQDSQLRTLNALHFAVRIDQRGELLRDYHTAQKYKPNGDLERNYVTNRYYMEDAVYLAGLAGEDAEIEKIFCALEKPYFQLYLGRRSLPVNPDFLLGLSEGDVFGNLETYPWQAAEWFQKKYKDRSSIRLDVYGDRGVLPQEGRALLRQDQAESFSQLERRFGFRYETHCRVEIENPRYDGANNHADTDHDVFASLLEDYNVLVQSRD